MLENRPIVAITIGYLIGIILGLYLKFSIVLLYFVIFIIYIILKKPHINNFKLISFRRYFRYVKIFFTKKVIIMILISAVCSNTITLYKKLEYEKFWKENNNKVTQIHAKVISNCKIKKYKKVCIIQTRNKRFYLNLDKNNQIDNGDYIIIKGILKKPKERTNYKGFDYQEYLKSKSIYGTIICKEVQIIRKNRLFFNQIFLKIKKNIQNNFNKEISDILLGIILGYTDEIEEEIRENFSKSNISHILAVSGMHIGYLFVFCSFILDKLAGKKCSKIFGIIIIYVYINIIGYSPSAIRAVIMGIMALLSQLLYRKSDVWTNLSLSLLILLIYNPFSVTSSGLLFSYMATFGILTYSKKIKLKNKIYNIIGITISATLFITPILAIYLHKIPIFSLVISIIVCLFVGIIFIEGIIYILLSNFFKLSILKYILNFFIKLLIFFSNFGSKIPLNQIYVITPNLIEIFLYFFLIFFNIFIFSIYKSKTKQNETFNKRIRNLVSLAKFRYRQNKTIFVSALIVFVFIFTLIKITPSNLKLYFIDVGQGDSCLIVTPSKKTILVDGGGNESYDVGKNVLVPYLLARRIKNIDYILISHFDTDHIGGVLTVMEELKVNTVIISKQGEKSQNYEKLEKIVNDKHINVKIVEKGDRIDIEKNIFFNILWPDSKNFISENILNNNSIVCKLNYKKFSVLFTGDIEEIAEKQIIQEYRENLQILDSNILKVAHHGSKSSSIQDFINNVNPKLALIGVGENNTFGHPNSGVVARLENLRCKNI